MVSSMINWQVSQTQQENEAEVLCFSALRQCFALIDVRGAAKRLPEVKRTVGSTAKPKDIYFIVYKKPNSL